MSSRLCGWLTVASLAAGLSGCCAGPCRFYQNAYGFEDPDIEYFCPGPPPPVTTPPGFRVPALAPIPAEDVTAAMPGDPDYPPSGVGAEPTDPQPLPQP